MQSERGCQTEEEGSGFVKLLTPYFRTHMGVAIRPGAPFYLPIVPLLYLFPLASAEVVGGLDDRGDGLPARTSA